jgi:Fe-S-cluster containining protein
MQRVATDASHEPEIAIMRTARARARRYATAMSDPERLQRVAVALADAITAREEGRRVKLPVIQRADAAGLTGMLHAELDEAIARRDAYLGNRIACTMGCNACCHTAVVVTEGEAVAVAEWLKDPAHADARARFEHAYAKWRDTLGELVDHAGDDHGDDITWSTAVRRANALCAFNHEGACTIYPVRPSLCRKAHAIDSPEHCSDLVEIRIPYFQHAETEETYEAQRPIRFAMHSSLRPNHRFDLLCSAVHRLLGGAAAGRNDPCPCNSGKKFKKCCGA